MQISKEQLDDLNAVVTIAVEKQDYAEKVEKVLGDYRKKANIPGFRKGHVPMSLVKKQYGKAVLVDEVNKLLQDALEKYLTEEKLDVLGNPLPKPQDHLNWDEEKFTFEFEIGLAPDFEISLKPGKKVTWYKILPEEKQIDDQIANIRKHYGKLVSHDKAEKGTEIKIHFTNQEAQIAATPTVEWEKLHKNAQKALKNVTVGQTFTLAAPDIFTEVHDLMHLLGISHDKAHELKADIQLKIEEVNKRELAELNQELFDKLFGEGKVNSDEELRATLKEDFEKQLSQQSDQQLLNDMTQYLLDNTSFSLPENFLQKWIQQTGEKPLSEQEAADEYKKSEKGLRYQLIESKLIRENEGLKVTYLDLKDQAKTLIAGQMAQFGQNNVEDAQLEEIAGRILSNQDEAKRLSEMVFNVKLIKFFKENCGLKEKEITYDKFIKEVYG